MLGVEVWVLVVIALALVVGTIVQSVVGLGLGLVGAPTIAFVAPELMPTSMVLLAAFLPLVTLVREHSEIHWSGLAWAFPPRVAGTALGVWVVATVDERQLGIGVGAMVVVAVLLSARTVVVPITRATLGTAGFVSGVTGTATSIGGPPLALLYQRQSAAQIRSTMAVFFLVGAVISLAGLGLGGQVTRQEILVSVTLAPALLVGSLLSGPVRRGLHADSIRPLVLLVCGASGSVLLVRSLLG